MQLATIAAISADVAGTRSRLKKVDMLADCLRRLDPEELRPGICYLAGALPQGKIGLGYAAMSAVTVETARETSLRVADTHAALQRISEQQGPGSQARRQGLLEALFGKATSGERQFLVRLLLGELRQGALEGVMTDAIAKAFDLAVDAVRRAVMLSGDLATVAEAARLKGRSGLADFSLQLFRPLRPMLAQPAGSVREAIDRIGQTALEYKLDGARVQVHKRGAEIRVFTRHLNEVTDSVPELVEQAARLPCETIILDGEAIALDAARRPLPFQVTMRRFGRRIDVERVRERLPLSVAYFDCLHLNGTDLIDQPDRWRIQALHDVVPHDAVVPRLVTDREDEADEFLQRALAAGHKGIVAKAPQAPYQAGSRGADWYKVKPAHSLDLVVLAAEWGSGRREGWLSNLHLGARDSDQGGFVMLGKTFKGMTDATLAWQTRELLAREIGREGHVVHVRPELVVEVAFNELQRSRQYPAGVALRFARVKRYRPDKTAPEADTLETVRAIYAARFRDGSG